MVQLLGDGVGLNIKFPVTMAWAPLGGSQLSATARGSGEFILGLESAAIQNQLLLWP